MHSNLIFVLGFGHFASFYALINRLFLRRCLSFIVDLPYTTDCYYGSSVRPSKHASTLIALFVCSCHHFTPSTCHIDSIGFFSRFSTICLIGFFFIDANFSTKSSKYRSLVPTCPHKIRYSNVGSSVLLSTSLSS